MARQRGSYYIPEITDERIEDLLHRMWSVVRFSDGNQDRSGELYYIHSVDARSIAFTWDPYPTDLATDLVELARIQTLHTYGYHGMFKPSVAEVLEQIPEEYLDETVAFETHGPETVHDLNREHDALDAGFHVAETILYRRT
jgi:hypothetical protein